MSFYTSKYKSDHLTKKPNLINVIFPTPLLTSPYKGLRSKRRISHSIFQVVTSFTIHSVTWVYPIRSVLTSARSLSSGLPWLIINYHCDPMKPPESLWHNNLKGEKVSARARAREALIVLLGLNRRDSFVLSVCWLSFIIIINLLVFAGKTLAEKATQVRQNSCF
jgi:hypothetical protein